MHDAFGPPKKTDMAKLTQHKPRSWKKIIFVGAVFLAVSAAVFGFFYFTRAQRFTGKGVQLSVLAPETIASGGDVTLTIRYENREAVALHRVQLAVTYPDGFSYTRSSKKPDNEAKNAFQIDDLRPGVGGQIEITGRLVGDVGSSRTVTATLSYVPETFNSEFTTRASSVIKLAESVLEVKFDGPLRVMPETEVTYTLTYTNRSRGKISESRFSFEAPDGFNLAAAEPTTDSNRTWTIRDLEPNGGGTITLRGSFTGELGSLFELIGRAGLTNPDGTLQLQTEKRLIVQIVRPELSISTSVNGSSEDQSTTFGSALKFVLSYANQTDDVVDDVEVRATLEGSVIDWDSLTATSAPTRDNNVLTWTKTEVPELARLKPGTKGELAFTIRVSGQPGANDAAGPSVIARTTLKGNSPELGSNIETDAAPLTVKVNSRVTLTTEARYYTEDFTKLGDGPIPPVVGSTTRYRIVWSLENTVNEVGSAVVTTTLPADVYWTGRVSEASFGALTFDPKTRHLSWSIGTILPNTGSDNPKLTAGFELSITPTAADIGKVLVLTDSVHFKGIDGFTKSELTDTHDGLTTNCDADRYARGQGVVQSVPTDQNANTNTNS